ncbi:MAG: MFS transporter [Pacificimonas sp.]
MLNLLVRRRFGPLFAVQYLGAFNDNLFRFGLLFLVTFRIMADRPEEAATLVTLAAGLFTLPFVLFSGLAGQIVDAIDKARVIRWVKLAEIVIMLAGAAALWSGSIPLMLVILFLMGLQSTLFGPVKYAILPQHLKTEEMMGGMSLIEAGTFLAILTGQIGAGLIPPEATMIAIILVAAVGYLAARAIPSAPPAPGPHPISANIAKSGWAVLRHLFRHRHLWLSVLVGCWFWAVGIVFTTMFLPLVQGVLGGTEEVATLFLIAFSVGIALGSLIIGKVLQGLVSARTLGVSLLLMAVATFDLVGALNAFPAPGPVPRGVGDFLAIGSSWRILVDLTLIAVGGGSFIVPIYTIMMTGSEPALRARTIAANNILNSTAMVAAAGITGALVSAGLSIPDILLIGGVISILMIWPAWQLRKAVKGIDLHADDEVVPDDS